MKKKLRQYSFIFVLLACTVLLGLNYYYQPFYNPSAQSTRPTPTPVVQVEPVQQATSSGELTSALAKLEKLSKEERVMQLLAAPLILDSTVAATTQSADIATDIEREYPDSPGFFTVFGADIPFEVFRTKVVNLKNQYFKREVLPLVAVDHEGGVVQRLSGEGFTRLSSWQTVCKLPEEDRLEILEVVAKELARAGVDVVLGPVVDVGKSTALKERICSTEYPLTALVSYEFSYALNKVGILPVLKHFPGIGTVNTDLHSSFARTKNIENDLKLYNFLITELDRVAVMTSHAGVTGKNEDLPCSLSSECIGQLTTEHPSLLVFSDALEMQAAAYDAENPTQPKTLVMVSREAFLAGNDVLLYGPSVTREEILAIAAAFVREYEYDVAFQEKVDATVLKILEYKAGDR